MELLPPNLGDATLWVGSGGILMGIAAIIKTITDAWKDRGKQRNTNEESIRDDLMNQNKELREEIKILYRELSETRREMRELADNAAARLRQCEDRAVKFQRELGLLRGQIAIRHPEVIHDEPYGQKNS